MTAETLTQPAVMWVPPGSTMSAATEAADLAAAVGQPPFPEQRLALEVLLAEVRERGRPLRWAAFEAAIVCGRQNMKTWCLQMSVLHDLFVRQDARRIVWTAHRFKTTQSAFEDFVHLIEANDLLGKQVLKVRTSNADKSIHLRSGARLDFLARTSGGGRGLTGDVVVLDEALFLSAAMMGSLIPTMSARSVNGNPQVRYGSSAGLLDSEVLRGLRDRGRALNDPTLAYVEWSVPRGGCASLVCEHELDTPGCLLDDEAAWASANPALGRRISRDFIRAERRSLTPGEFARERLGWWDEEGAADVAVPLTVWTPLADSSSSIAGRVVFAVDVAPDRSTAAIGVYGEREDGVGHLEVVDHRTGASWVVDRLMQLRETWLPSAIVLDPQSAAGGLLPDLQAQGVTVTLASGRGYGQACGALYDALVAQSVRHLDQPALNEAVGGAKRRPLGDAWAFGRRSSSVDITPLVAVTLARWGFLTAESTADPVMNIW